MSTTTKSIIHEATGSMTKLCRKVVRVNLRFRWKILDFRPFIRVVWSRILGCSIGKPIRYRRLSERPSSPPTEVIIESGLEDATTAVSCGGYETDSDLVTLKISLLGDCQIGKTSFMLVSDLNRMYFCFRGLKIKYVGSNEGKRSMQMQGGLNLMDKTLVVQGARIAFTIWDVAGDSRSVDQVEAACKDAVAILFMFDLTSRCTLNSVIGWYTEARKWNKTAVPILVGTKFDDFVRLPPNLQWTIVTQARAYARAMKATVFFSSATHNINVNKIFKFIMAKLFNLPWTVESNVAIGEPIIDVY